MRITEAMHNKYEKIFNDYLKELEFTENKDLESRNEDSKNIIIEKKYAKKIDELRNLCIDVFDDNKKLYKKNRFIGKMKLFFWFDVPLIVLLTSIGFNLTSPKKSEIAPVYNVETTWISDGKVVTEVDDTNYIVSDYENPVTDEKFEIIDDANPKIQYQIKNGTNNVIVSITVKEDGQLKITNCISGNFYDFNASIFKDVEPGEIEEKYREILDDITEFILNDQTILSRQGKATITEFLENEKSVIITSFIEYIKTGEIEVKESDKEQKSRNATKGIISLIVWGVFMLALGLITDFKFYPITYDEDDLNLKLCRDYVILSRKTLSAEKEVFIEVERKRRARIQDFAYDNLEGEAKKKFLS